MLLVNEVRELWIVDYIIYCLCIMGTVSCSF